MFVNEFARIRGFSDFRQKKTVPLIINFTLQLLIGISRLKKGSTQ